MERRIINVSKEVQPYIEINESEIYHYVIMLYFSMLLYISQIMTHYGSTHFIMKCQLRSPSKFDSYYSSKQCIE